MRKTLTALVFLLSAARIFGQGIPCGELPSKPSNAINDFANTINDATESELESQSRQYWNTTSIAVVVVTVPTLNDNDPAQYAQDLYNCWGVGDKTSRGVLLLHAPTERKVHIATGVGIEPFLTDVECKHIVENNIIPRLKEGDLTGGIESGVSGIMTVLGRMSWEDRIAAVKERERIAQQEEATRRAERQEIFMMIVGALLICAVGGLLYLLLRFIMRHIHARRINNALIKEIEQGRKLIKDALAGYDRGPNWARTEAKIHHDKAVTEISKVATQRTESMRIIWWRPVRAYALSLNAQQHLEKAFASFKKMNESLRDKVLKFSREAQPKHEKVKVLLNDTAKVVESFGIEGYIVSNEKLDLGRYSDQLEATELQLADMEHHKFICETMDFITSKLVVMTNHLTAVAAEKQSIDRELPSVVNACAILAEQVDSQKSSIEQLKRQYHTSAWEDLVKDFNRLVPSIAKEVVEKTKTEIEFNNNFKAQKFIKAKQLFDGLIASRDAVAGLFTRIQEVATDQVKCQQEFPEKYAITAEKVTEALRVVKDSDVGEETKKKAKKTSAELAKIQQESTSTFINWILLIALLAKCKKDAEDTIKEANSEIKSAEDAREEAAREEAARLRRNSESSFTSSGSFTSFTSGGGSSFGGFSGGFSGGGGAGGSY